MEGFSVYFWVSTGPRFIRGGCGFPAPVFSRDVGFLCPRFLDVICTLISFLAVFPGFISGSHNQGETGQNPQQAPEKERLWVIKAVLFWWDLLFVLT